MAGESILIIDDEKSILMALSGILKDENFEVLTAENGSAGLEIIKNYIPDVVMLDIWMPGIDGLETLKLIKEFQPELPVIMMSGHGTIETAVKATKLGAYDFIEKPLSLEKTIITVQHALDQQRLEQENRFLRQKVNKKYAIIGKSNVLQELKKQIAIAAPTSGRILICGENGTGKELIARAIHNKSLRKDNPFVEVNCAAIPEDLIESELFGHEKGAFTGATSRRYGKFELADKGTIFLDEIGDMSLKTQAKVLRVLEEQVLERVGGTKSINVDVRVIAASNKNLEEEIKKSNFREDLFYRLNVIPFNVPPLRERKSDIPILSQYFIEEFSRENGKKVKKIDGEVMEKFTHYDWPGNIRELKNVIERLVIMVPSQTITIKDIPLYSVDAPSRQHEENINTIEVSSLKDSKDKFERAHILKQLKTNNWNVAKTAKFLQIERSNLHRKIKAYNIKIERN